MRRPGFLRDTTGGAALEFALIALPLLMFTFGIIEFSRALFLKQGLNYAIDAAARQLYLDPATPEAQLATLVGESLVLADSRRLTVRKGAPIRMTGADYALIRLTVDYDFVSAIPSVFTDTISLHAARNVIVKP